jgi:hypothetical protein
VQFREPVSGGGVVHGAVLECGVVALDGGFLRLDLGEDGTVFGVLVGVAVAVAGLGAGDGVGDEVAGLGVEVAEGLEYGGVGLVGGQAGGGDGAGPLPGRAFDQRLVGVFRVDIPVGDPPTRTSPAWPGPGPRPSPHRPP